MNLGLGLVCKFGFAVVDGSLQRKLINVQKKVSRALHHFFLSKLAVLLLQFLLLFCLKSSVVDLTKSFR